MPEGKDQFSDKEDRMADHIKESEQERGKSEGEAERIAYATVNKHRREKKGKKELLSSN